MANTVRTDGLHVCPSRLTADSIGPRLLDRLPLSGYFNKFAAPACATVTRLSGGSPLGPPPLS